MRKSLSTTRAFSLVETLLYMALFSLVSVLVVNMLLQSMKSFSALRDSRAMNESAVYIMERLTRDIKNSTSINMASSTFGMTPGRLTLNTVNASGTALTVEYYVASSTLRIKENGVDKGPLMSTRTKIKDLFFSNIITSASTTGVRIKLQLHTGRDAMVADTAPANGLIAHWTFDTSDTNWVTSKTNDVSGQANTGTMINMSTTTAPVPGKVGQALAFDGVNDCVDGGSQAILDNVPTATFVYWAYFKTTSASDQAYMGKDVGGMNSGDVQIRVRNSSDATNPNKIQLITQTAPSTEDIINSNSAITVNKWMHIAMIIGASGKSMYINNVKQSATSANTQGMSNATPNFSIGAIRVPCTGFTNVVLDDVRIYNRALTAGEIAALYGIGAVNTNKYFYNTVLLRGSY